MALTETSPQKQVFGYGLVDGSADLHTVGSSKSGFGYKIGIPPMYASKSGKKAVRADMNGLGRLMSLGAFFNAQGGYYTFDPKIAASIGGYPEGAILKWKDPQTGLLRSVRSLVPDNNADFVSDPSLIDNEHWAFVDLFVPKTFRPRIFPDWNAKTSGELAVGGGVFVAEKDCALFIQAGSSADTAPGNTPVMVWANVRKAGADKFSSAAMLAYIPPVPSAYGMYGINAQFVDGRLEKLAKYTAYYSASPICIYLNPGDTVMLSASNEISYTSGYVCVPLGI